MAFETILFEVRDRIATITINNPKKHNILAAPVLRDLRDAFGACRDDETVGAVILTGAGDKAFIAGADIRELAGYTAEEGASGSLAGQDVTAAIEGLGKPVIAAINGFCFGGGCELALACTMRVASETAKIGQPEVKIGIIAGFGGTQRLPRLVGKGKAAQMLLTGEPVDAREAHRIGLVDEVTAPDRLMPFCRELAAKILANAPLAIKYTLRALQHGTEVGLKEALAYEASLFGLACGTADKNEGMRAFLEKPAPGVVGP